MQMDNEHHLQVTDAVFLLFTKGKDLEVRVNSPNTQNIGTGDIIIINERLRFLVMDRRRYASFDEMLAKEDSARILPGYTAGEILKFLRGIYGSREDLGVLVFELQEYIQPA